MFLSLKYLPFKLFRPANDVLRPELWNIDPTIRSSWNVHNDSLTYYFSVIDVSGNTVTVNSYKGYTGVYSQFDTFTVTR